jgi:hypothetical protein
MAKRLLFPTIVRPGRGPIEPEVLYPLEDLKARSGLGSTAMRTLRGQGLPVRYAAGHCYILGRDFIDHIMQEGKPEKNA